MTKVNGQKTEETIWFCNYQVITLPSLDYARKQNHLVKPEN